MNFIRAVTSDQRVIEVNRHLVIIDRCHVTSDPFIIGHGELQQHPDFYLSDLSKLTARKGLPGHEIYAIVRNASELIESCGKERELQLEAVSAMRRANATAIEMVRAFEDAWVLDDEAWIEAAGSKDELVKVLTAAGVDDEGRRCSCRSGTRAPPCVLNFTPCNCEPKASRPFCN